VALYLFSDLFTLELCTLSDINHFRLVQHAFHVHVSYRASFSHLCCVAITFITSNDTLTYFVHYDLVSGLGSMRTRSKE
jgi:uncharacterized membrane protein YpjA